MTQRARLALATMLLAVLVVVAYAPVERGVFVWDDHPLVAASQAHMHEPVTSVFTKPFWTNDPSMDARPAYYRPIVVLSYRVDLVLDEDNPASFHVTNLILHVLATVLLVAAAWRMTSSVTASLLAGALWSLAPRLTESVAWVSGRTDVLAAIFVFAALLLWPWLGPTERRGTERARQVRAILGSMALLAALLAKESAIGGVLALAMATWATVRHSQNAAKVMATRGAYLVGAVVAYLVLRSHAMAAVRFRPPQSLGPMLRAETVLEAIGRYAVMAVDAFRPSTSIGLVGEPSIPCVLVGAFVVVFAVIAFARTSKRGAPLGIAPGFALAIGALAPVVHVIPIGLSAAVVADRLLYLPLAGLALAGATLASRLAGRPAFVAAVAAGALAVSFVPFVSRRATDYTDELRFRLAAVDSAHPENTAPATGLATVLRAHGEHALACRIHESVRVRLEKAGRTSTPRYVRALENIGQCFALFGDYARADDVYEALARDNPSSGRIRMEIGYLALHRLDLVAAEAHLRRALALDPSLDTARALLGQMPKVRSELQRLATPEARVADRRGWATLMSRLGRRAEANAAWLAIVEDTSGPFGDATYGLVLLLEQGDYDTVVRAIDAWERRVPPADINLVRLQILRRTSQHERFVASRARIEAYVARLQ